VTQTYDHGTQTYGHVTQTYDHISLFQRLRMPGMKILSRCPCTFIWDFYLQIINWFMS